MSRFSWCIGLKWQFDFDITNINAQNSWSILNTINKHTKSVKMDMHKKRVDILLLPICTKGSHTTLSTKESRLSTL